MMKSPQLLFGRLAAKIQPLQSEYQKLAVHSFTVKRRLNKSFDLKKFLKIGSHSRNTAIRLYSDIDFLAVLTRNEAKYAGRIVNSSSFLEKVRDDLSDRYTQTQVSRDGQAVAVHFGGGQHAMDIVPAIFSRFDKMRPVYLIPDGNNGWIETSPERHNRYILDANERSGSKLVKVIRLLKYWKICRRATIPLRSFHIDILLAASNVCAGVKTYARCLYDCFQLLSDRQCNGIRDPLGLSGIIRAATTESQLEEIKLAIDYAAEHAKAAIQAEAWGDFAEAVRQWGIVFNGQI